MICKTYPLEKRITHTQNKKIISLNEPNEYIMCEAIEDYKRLDSQHELQTTTLNQTRLDKATLMS